MLENDLERRHILCSFESLSRRWCLSLAERELLLGHTSQAPRSAYELVDEETRMRLLMRLEPLLCGAMPDTTIAVWLREPHEGLTPLRYLAEGADHIREMIQVAHQLFTTQSLSD